MSATEGRVSGGGRERRRHEFDRTGSRMSLVEWNLQRQSGHPTENC